MLRQPSGCCAVVLFRNNPTGFDEDELRLRSLPEVTSTTAIRLEMPESGAARPRREAYIDSNIFSITFSVRRRRLLLSAGVSMITDAELNNGINHFGSSSFLIVR